MLETDSRYKSMTKQDRTRVEQWVSHDLSSFNDNQANVKQYLTQLSISFHAVESALPSQLFVLMEKESQSVRDVAPWLRSQQHTCQALFPAAPSKGCQECRNKCCDRNGSGRGSPSRIEWRLGRRSSQWLSSTHAFKDTGRKLTICDASSSVIWRLNDWWV